MSSKIKNILIVVVAVAVLVSVYFFFIKKGPTEASLTSSTGVPLTGENAQNAIATSEISKDFISILLSVKSIKLDDSIFSDPAYISLKDSTITLVQVGDEGRPNPFAPIGSESTVLPKGPTIDGSIIVDENLATDLIPAPITPNTNGSKKN